MTKIDTPSLETLLDTMAEQLQAYLQGRAMEQPLMVGIHTGGAWVAERLHRRLGWDSPLGTLDISFYRDDFSRIGMHPEVKPSNLPFEVEDRHIVLVDDVLHTGRTIRAALNEIFDYGRPASVTLLTLVERSGRELPIQADITGMHITLGEGEHIKLSGPDPLNLTVQRDAQG